MTASFKNNILLQLPDLTVQLYCFKYIKLVKVFNKIKVLSRTLNFFYSTQIGKSPVHSNKKVLLIDIFSSVGKVLI